MDQILTNFDNLPPLKWTNMVILLSTLCQVTLSGISTDPLSHPLLLVPVVIECPLGRQAGGKLLDGPRDQDK